MSTLVLILALMLTVGIVLITGVVASQYGGGPENFFSQNPPASHRSATTGIQSAHHASGTFGLRTKQRLDNQRKVVG
jgi:hypothetical protein